MTNIGNIPILPWGNEFNLTEVKTQTIVFNGAAIVYVGGDIPPGGTVSGPIATWFAIHHFTDNGDYSLDFAALLPPCSTSGCQHSLKIPSLIIDVVG